MDCERGGSSATQCDTYETTVQVFTGDEDRDLTEDEEEGILQAIEADENVYDVSTSAPVQDVPATPDVGPLPPPPDQPEPEVITAVNRGELATAKSGLGRGPIVAVALGGLALVLILVFLAGRKRRRERRRMIKYGEVETIGDDDEVSSNAMPRVLDNGEIVLDGWDGPEPTFDEEDEVFFAPNGSKIYVHTTTDNDSYAYEVNSSFLN